MDNSIISIIIPTYERAHLIGETLDSILAQSYQNWECIIVDDNSLDDTESIIDEYITRDQRFQFYKKPKHLQRGPSASRNFGFQKSKGNYINWLDSDDLMHPEKLKIDLKNINSGDYDFTISQSKFFSEDGDVVKEYWNKNLWSNDPMNDFIKKKIGWGVNSPLWKKNSLEGANLKFDENLINADDFLYHIMALQFNLKPFICHEILMDLREHSQRLNDFYLKAPSKLIVNLYLLKRKEELELNEDTIVFLNHQFLRQLASLFKKKKISLARAYYKKRILNEYTFITKITAFKLYFLGYLFNVSSKGYSFLNVR